MLSHGELVFSGMCCVDCSQFRASLDARKINLSGFLLFDRVDVIDLPFYGKRLYSRLVWNARKSG